MPMSYVVYGSLGFLAAAVCVYFILRIASKDKTEE
jgi:hypothetical protein